MNTLTSAATTHKRAQKFAQRKFVNQIANALALAAMAFGLFWLFWICCRPWYWALKACHGAL